MFFKLLVVIKFVYKVALKGRDSLLKNLADWRIHSLIKTFSKKKKKKPVELKVLKFSL